MIFNKYNNINSYPLNYENIILKGNKKLISLVPRYKYNYFDIIDSTSEELSRKIINNKIGNFDIVIANYQTKGRGRQGNSWKSPLGENLLFSLAIEMKTDANEFIKLMISICSIIAKNIELYLENKEKIQFKWPNDIFIKNKKVSGILLEIKNINKNFLLIGIGINTNSKSISNSISISEIIKKNVNRSSLLIDILNDFANYYTNLTYVFLDSIKWIEDRSLLNNKLISMEIGGEIVTGTCLGIKKNDGKLILKTKDKIELVDNSKNITIYEQ